MLSIIGRHNRRLHACECVRAANWWLKTPVRIQQAASAEMKRAKEELRNGIRVTALGTNVTCNKCLSVYFKLRNYFAMIRRKRNCNWTWMDCRDTCQRYRIYQWQKLWKPQRCPLLHNARSDQMGKQASIFVWCCKWPGGSKKWKRESERAKERENNLILNQ